MNNFALQDLAIIGLGSNSLDAKEKLTLAIEKIAKMPHLELLKQSQCYLTEPQGFKEQPWFHNQVVVAKIDTNFWNAQTFLEELLKIEKDLGRKRDLNSSNSSNNHRFGPRCIDLDLLLFANQDSTEAQCILPHPRMKERAFVLIPLLELLPEIHIANVAAKDLLQELNYSQQGNKIWQK